MSAFAQVGTGQWVDGLYLVSRLSEFPFPKVLIDEKNNIHKTIPNVAKAVDFPVSAVYLQFSLHKYWHNDALYIIAFGTPEKNENGSAFHRWTFAKWKEEQWYFIGDYKPISWDSDCFIVVTAGEDLTFDNRRGRSPFHRMSVNPNKIDIRLDSSIDYSISIVMGFAESSLKELKTEAKDDSTKEGEENKKEVKKAETLAKTEPPVSLSENRHKML